MTITSVNDGSSDKFYRAWADSADGSKGFSTTDSSKEYFGVYAGITPPSNYKAYSWTKIKGDSGRSVTDTEMEYAINDSKTTPPTSGWSLEMPVWKTGLFIWQRVKVSYSTGNPSYTTPHCLESNIIDDVTGNIGDWIFRDKTEILSGTEIFTDKADDNAVVHVEVDGKSWQEGIPSPDSPSEIHNLNDFDVVSSVGKENLIGDSNTIKGGWITDTGTLQVSTSLPRVASDFIEIVPGSDMTFTYDGYDYTGSSTKKVMGVYDKDKIFIERLASTVLDKVWKIKLNSQAKFVRVAYGTSSSEYDNYAKLEVGSESTPWNYSHKDLENNLNNNFIDKISLLLDKPLRSVGDVKDRLFRDTNGLWKVERNVVEIVLNGTENWTQGSDNLTGVFRYYSSSITLGNESRNADIGICSHLKTNSSTAHNQEGAVFGVGNRHPYLFLNKTKYPTPASVKSWILNESNKGTPVVLQFRLETPITEALPQPLQDKLNNLRTFKDSNYIYTVLPDKSNILSENLKPTLHATFKSIAWANDFRYKFEQSKAMHATDIWFAKGVSNTIAPNIGWSTDAPVWEDGLYIWSKTITTYGDGRTEETSPVCITGATGRSVDKIEEWYYLSNKSNLLEGGTWSKTPPTWTDGKYIWTKNKIIYKNPSGSEETAPINNTGGSGQKGETGTDARTVRLNNVIHAVHFDQDGLMPSVTSIAFPTVVQGFSGVTPYYEFKMGSTIVRGLSTDSSWTLNTSAMKYSDFPLAVTVNVVIGGQTLATDTVTIVGTKPGEDAYTVVLANESHTFVGDVSNAMAGNTTANIIAYRGGTQVGATIGTITGLPTGMTSTVYSNGTTSARVTFTVTTSMKSPNGVVNIPVTVNGKSFTKVFNYAIAFKGAKGDKGTDGVAGKDGVGIRTTVLAYASSTSGTTTPTSGWTTTVPTVAPGNYLWTRTTWNYSDNSSENGYTVSRIGKDGNTGANGVAGKDGVGIKSTVIHYGGSTSGTSHSGVAWTTAIPSVSNGQFLWTRTTWTYDDNTTETGYSVAKMGETGAKGDKGDKGDRGTDGIAGKDGVGIKTTTLNYVSSTNGTTAPTSGWTTTIPTVAAGNYLWTRTIWTYTDNSTETGYSVSRIGKDGNTGANGIAGKDGVGLTSTTITYAASTSGTTAPTSGWATTVPTVAVGSFLWTRTVWAYTDGTSETGYSVGKMGDTGPTGATGAKGATGERGPQGATGVSVQSITEYYLATSAASGVTSATGGWTTAIQTMTSTNKYLWNYELVNFSDGSTQPTLPVIIGVYGDKGQTGSTGATGRSITGITEHYLATNLASGVTRSTSGWSTTMQTTTSDKKYLWNYETITWSSGTTTTYVEPIIIGVHGATGATGATGPKGATGSQGPKGDTGTSVSSVTEYYLATASSTGVTTSTSGWTTTIQTMTATNKYLWNYEQINFSDGTNQPTLPVIIGAYGDKGQTGSTGATGRSITGITEHYLASNLATGVTRTTSGWTTTMQQTDPTKKYLWNYETITWSSGTTTTYVEPIIIGIHGEQGPQGIQGPKGATGSQGPQGNVGTSVTGITEYYLATSASSGVTTSTSGWTTSIQTMTATNKYLWNYEKVNFSDGTNQPTVPVIIGVYGDKGATGSTGATGRSITAIQEYYLATSASTGVTRSTANWSTTMQTTSPTNKYLWNYEKITWSSGTTTTYVEPIIIGIHGEQGPQGPQGATGARGPQGATGVSVSSITEYYLATSASSGVTTSTSGWVTTMPTMTTTNKYLWNYEKINFSDGTNQPTIPVIIGVHGATGATGGTGATGRSITSITEHYLATSAASGVTRSTSGWSTTMKSTTTTNKYLWNYETINWSSGTTPTYVEPIIIGVHGATGATGATGAKGNPGENATARNFLLDSKPSSPITNSNYPIASFLLAEKPIVGETYTITIKGQLASTKTAFYAYNSGGSISVASNIVHQGNGLYYKSFNWINSYSSGVTANDTSVVIYPFTSSQTGTSTIEWVSLVKGSVPLTEWVPAHEDLKKGIDDLENAVNNTSPTGENLIVNGGFENSKGHQAYGWNPSYELYSPGHSGSKCLIWRANSAVRNLTHLAMVPVVPGRTYEYGYWASSSADANGASGNNKMRLGRSDGSHLSDVGITGAVNSDASWVKYAKEYTIPSDVHEVRVSLVSNNTVGWYKIDDVFMYDITDRKSIEEKADGSATEAALNEAAAKLQVLQQEVEAAATSNELKDFINKYNKDMASRDKDARDSESSLSTALTSINSIQTNMGVMSATWQFVDRFIKNTPQGIVVGNDSSGSYILIKEDRLAFYSNGQEVAFISQNLMEISRGAFVEEIQIAKYKFEESTTNHLTIRYVG